MANIKINGRDFDTDNFSDNAKAQLQMLQTADREINRLQTKLAIAQTARSAYGRALAEAVGITDLNATIQPN
jgi:hypothetical protein